MAHRIFKLTKRVGDALKGRGADTVSTEEELAGFGVRVRKSGRKNYVVQTRVAGKLRCFTIGRHDLLSAEEARAKALEILAMIEKMVLTVREVANLLRVDHETVYRLVKCKELPGFKVAGSVGS